MDTTRNLSTKTTTAFLPTEVIHDEILPKLPVKSLIRFKCVSKSFNILISSPEFIDLHLRTSLSSDADRLLILAGENYTHLYSIDIDSQDSVPAKIPLPLTLDEWFDGVIVSIVGTFNGLICVGLELRMGFPYEFSHVVINPSTGVYRPIPNIIATRRICKFRVSFGFGFDDLNHDYKLVRIMENAYEYDRYAGDRLYDREVIVFSLNEDLWKLVEYVDGPSHSLRSDSGVLVKNNLLHWVFWNWVEFRIYCFDVRSDKWANEVPLMDLFTDPMADFDEENEDKVVNWINLGVLHGCLCLSASSRFSQVVWIMKEYGVKESWVKLFEISHSIGPSKFYVYDIFGYRKGSEDEVLVRKENNGGLYWFNIGSDIDQRTEEIKGVPAFEEACFLKGSLLPIPDGHQIKPSIINYDELVKG